MPLIGNTNVPQQYVADVNNAAAATGLPASVVAAQINEESGFDPSVVSSAGAQGIAQFIPSTFAAYGTGSPFNVGDAFAAYTKLMSVLLKQFNGNVADALAAYNAGPGALAAGRGYADTILANAGQSTGLVSGAPGASPQPVDTNQGGGTGSTTAPTTTAPTTSNGLPVPNLISVIANFMSELATIVHDIAKVLNFGFNFTKPGGWERVVTGAIAFFCLDVAVHLWFPNAPTVSGAISSAANARSTL
jgi:Transglycosylase SLT domain